MNTDQTISSVDINKLYDKKKNLVYQMSDVSEKVKTRTKPGEVPLYTEDEDKQFRGWDTELKQVTATIENLEREKSLQDAARVRSIESQNGDGSESTKVSASIAEQRSVWAKVEKKGVDALSKSERKVYDKIADQSRAFEKFLRFGAESLNAEEAAELSELKTNIVDKSEKRAQTVTTTGGGYAIPQGFNPDIQVALKAVSPFFQESVAGPSAEAKSLFYFLNTASGNDLPIPTVDDTGNTGELLAINSDAFSASTDLTFGQIIMKAYKYSPKPMKVPNELLADSGINLPELIGDSLGTRLGRIINTQLTTGDNSAKPQGIITGATRGKVSASATATTFPEILDLVHSVDPSYRKSASCRFMLHDNILLYLKKLTIGSSTNDSRPVWQPGFAMGAPDTIDGVPYLINQDMASAMTTGQKILLFGDMKKYAVRQAGPFVLRLLTERFADYDQVAWVLFARFDGRTLNTNAIKYLELT